MNSKVMMAKRLIAGFFGLMAGTNVPIRWGQNAAMSSSGAIELPEPQSGDAGEIALLTRLAVHEQGHLEHTVPGFQTRLNDEEAGVWNALEDPRMEAIQMRTYPGAGVLLARGLDDMLERVQSRIDTGTIQGDRALQLALLIQGNLAVAPIGPIVAAGPRILQALAAHLDEKQQAAIAAAVLKLPRLASSLEAEQLAKDLVANLKQVEPPPPASQPGDDQADPSPDAGDNDAQGQGADAQTDPSPDGQSGDQGADPDAGDDDAEGQGADAGADAQTDPSPDGQSGDQGADPDAGGGDAQGQGADAASGAQTDSSSNGNPGQEEANQADQSQQPGMDLGELLRDAHAAKYGAPSGDSETDRDGGEMEAIEPLTAQEIARLRQLLAGVSPDATLEEMVAMAVQALEGTSTDEVGGGTEQLMTAGGYSLGAESVTTNTVGVRLQGVQSRLVNVLQRELQDQRKRPNRHTHAGGGISPQRFWRLKALGDTRVFRGAKPAAGTEAAVTILVDKSSSMDLQLATATEVALAFSLALQRIGRVRTRTAVFPGAGAITETLQAFGESPRACERRCADLEASGGTPVGAAVAVEMGLLAALRIRKQVIVVVTDDEPGDPHVLAQSLRHARATGVIVVGVSIGCDIRVYIPNSVSITETSELPEALARLFREDMVSLLVD